nr:MAG TPA: minor capsid component [Caudoviricetes sp.]
MDEEPINELLNITQKAFDVLYSRKSYKPDDLMNVPEFRAVVEHTAEVFSSAVPHEVPQEMRDYLEKDVFVFSGLKTHTQLTEARSYLKDENGNIVPYDRFEQKILKLNEQYNRHYLEAEYQFAVHSAQSAANWANLQENTSRYWLEYRTAGDERVRANHAVLNGICLPKDDDFWTEYYPPNGWRCRCVAAEVLARENTLSDSKKAKELGEKATTHIAPNGKNKLQMFRFNPGAEKKVFPPNNAYSKVVGAKDVKETLKEKVRNENIEDTSKYDDDIFKNFRLNAKEYAQSEAHQNALKINNKMRPAETFCVNKYTGDFFVDINFYLRNGGEPKEEFFERYKKVMNSALDKLESYKGYVFRGADLSSEIINKYKKAAETGEPYTENHYLSTSKDREKSFDRNTKYKILSKNGKQIEELSFFLEEKEVLFKEGTQFKILKVYVDEQGFNRIEMEEI